MTNSPSGKRDVYASSISIDYIFFLCYKLKIVEMWKSKLKGEKKDLGIREFKRQENFVLKN